jgi:hypothetical protein
MMRARQAEARAAGLEHPREISATHIVRRHAQDGTKLLANLLPFIEPGALLEARFERPVFQTYWPLAQAGSFAPLPAAPTRRRPVRRTAGPPVAEFTTPRPA